MTDLQILRQLKRKYDDDMVSALIGAGFTRNIYPKSQIWTGMLRELVGEAYADEIEERYENYVHRSTIAAKPFNEMKDGFIEKIIARDGYLNVVSKYIEKKGYREAIDYYIETHNPYFYCKDDGSYGVKMDDTAILMDKDFTVHQRLLRGEWQYVFTTNYDNALEFTNERFNMGYQVIRCDYELSRRKMARPIIKIHGSLVPSDKTLEESYSFDSDYSRRYIISREDYDTYFQRHEAFSYLLRVAMLSGSYMLLGFSGDDPNFHSWLEWVKDILDKNTQSSPYAGNSDNFSEMLVNPGEDDIKVFLVLIDSKEPISKDKLLFYKNHHIGVIHLDDPEIMRELQYFQNTPTNLRIDRLLNYIIGDVRDASSEMKAVETKPVSLSQMWQRLYLNIRDKNSIEDVVNDIRTRRNTERFLKQIPFHEDILGILIDNIHSLSEHEKEIIVWLTEDMGLLTSYLGVAVNEQMQENSGWENIRLHDETLLGVTDLIDDQTDFAKHENILRKLFHFDFSSAKQLLADWQPKGRYQRVKASVNFWYNRNNSLQQLDSYIMNAVSNVEKYVASFYYNCIDSGFSPYYPLNEYRNQGVIGLNDSILAIVEQMKTSKPDINAYGVETIYIHVGSKDHVVSKEMEIALRFIRLVTNEGFNLCYGISNIVKIVDWYKLFRRIYIYLPYPCLYYSCQYNDKKVLQRIGQDYAFDPEIKDDLPDLLHLIFKALACADTPGTVLHGMLQIGGQMFYGLKEAQWFNEFSDYLRNVYVPEMGAYLYSADAETFVQNAIVTLHDPEHISTVLTVLLNYFEHNPEDALPLLGYLRLDKINKLDDEQQLQLKKAVTDAEFNHSSRLLYYLQEAGLLPEDVRETFIDKYRLQKEIWAKADRYILYYFCMLSQDKLEIVKEMKNIILERNIWDSGIEGGSFSETGQIFIMELGDAYSWSENELNIIYHNLKTNLAKIKKEMLQNDLYFARSFINLLSQMQDFADKYPTIVEKNIRKEIDDKLSIVRRYDNIDDGLYSENPEVIEMSCRELNQYFRNGKFTDYQSSFEILISKCTLKSAPAVTACLVTISVAVHFCGAQISQNKEYLKMLYRLLLQYEGKDFRELDLQVVNASHALIEIASFLNTNGFNNEHIKWWIENENLNRLNFLDY